MSTRLWELDIPISTEYASLYPSYGEPRNAVRCTTCGKVLRQDSLPLTVEWEDGSDRIGDFVFCYGRVIVREALFERLLAQEPALAKGEIVFHDEPSLHRPQTGKPRRRKRVWLPYEGPALCELIPTHPIDLDPSSTVEIESRCDDCGATTYGRFEGVEDPDEDPPEGRRPGMGLFVRRDALGEHRIVRPRWTGLTLVTDEGRHILEEMGVTNCVFLEYGEVIEAGTSITTASRHPATRGKHAVSPTTPVDPGSSLDIDDLVDLELDVPPLDPDTAESCPVPLSSVLEYLHLESPDGEDIEPSDLRFRRSARLGEHQYWIWSFRESGGGECYVAVSVAPDGSKSLSYADNDRGLTPEQFLFGDQHELF